MGQDNVQAQEINELDVGEREVSDHHFKLGEDTILYSIRATRQEPVLAVDRRLEGYKDSE